MKKGFDFDQLYSSRYDPLKHAQLDSDSHPEGRLGTFLVVVVSHEYIFSLQERNISQTTTQIQKVQTYRGDKVSVLLFLTKGGGWCFWRQTNCRLPVMNLNLTDKWMNV